MEHMINYIKNLFLNSFFVKAILWAFMSTITVLMDWWNTLSLQFIFVCRSITMVIWTIAGIVETGFRFRKFFQWLFRLAWYWCILYFWISLDHSIGGWYVFPFFYSVIVLDMINSFLKHAPILWIWVSPKIHWFIIKLEEKINSIFIDKIK